MTTKDNMTLWDKICDTDKEKTPLKFVNLRGGFTEINAQSQCKWATELFGIYGVGWGLRNLKWGTLTDAAGKIELTLDCDFFAAYGKDVIEFPISNDMEYKANDDCRKKLLTNTRGKALSLIGMNSDVYEGKHDKKSSQARSASKPRKATTKAPKKAPAPQAKPTNVQEQSKIRESLFPGYGDNWPPKNEKDYDINLATIKHAWAKKPQSDAQRKGLMTAFKQIGCDEKEGRVTFLKRCYYAFDIPREYWVDSVANFTAGHASFFFDIINHADFGGVEDAPPEPDADDDGVVLDPDIDLEEDEDFYTG